MNWKPKDRPNATTHFIRRADNSDNNKCKTIRLYREKAYDCKNYQIKNGSDSIVTQNIKNAKFNL